MPRRRILDQIKVRKGDSGGGTEGFGHIKVREKDYVTVCQKGSGEEGTCKKKKKKLD